MCMQGLGYMYELSDEGLCYVALNFTLCATVISQHLIMFLGCTCTTVAMELNLLKS